MKFQPLVHIDGALRRDRIVARVLEAEPATASLTLVVAPAGFGKTTLLAQLAQREREHGVKVAWLNCDARDADPQVFADSLLTALKHCEVSQRAGLSAADPVVAAVAGLAHPVALFIDDYDQAAGAPVDDILSSIALAAPPQVRVMLACRLMPNVPLTRLQLAGRLRRIESEWLRFNREETEQLLGDSVPAAARERLAAYTEGWPFALQLARLRAVGGHGEAWAPDVDDRLPRRQIFDYLAQEVLGTLSQSTLAFLADVAILDEIDVAAANAIRQHDNSLHHIQELAALEPVVVVDEARWQARMHPLLRDFLLHQTNVQTPGRVQELHLRAAEHFSRSARIDDAVCHATAAGRFDMAAQMIETAGAIRLLVTLGEPRVRLLLRQLPAAMLQRPRLRLLLLGMQVEEHDAPGTEGEIARIEQHHAGELDENAELAVDLRLARCMLLLHESEHQLLFAPWAQLKAAVDEGRLRRPTDPLFLGLVLPIELFLLHRYGPVERAERRTREVEALYCDVQPLNTSPWVWMYHLRNALALGELERCERIGNESLKRDINFVKHSQRSLGQLLAALLGRALYEQGRLSEALSYLSAIVPTESVHFLEVQAGGLVDVARCEFWRGNTAHAIELLRFARDLGFEDNLPHLGLLASAVQIELEIRLGQDEAAHRLYETAHLEGLWEAAQPGGVLPWLVVDAIARARFVLQLRGGDAPGALQTAEILLALARQAGRRLAEIAALCMQARALAALQRTKDSDATLLGALPLAAACGARQLFIDLGAETLAHLRALMPGLPRALGDWTAQTLALWEAVFQRGLSASETFTERELEILHELAKDQTTKMIARTVMRSPETVKYHLKSIFSKLGVSNREDAVAEARRRALMP
jgi:ATP/maltotriose-dependent transcriptional regulator MalT